MEMNISLNAQVECRDGGCGHCTRIILDPRAKQVTHIVVREDSSPHAQRLVPMKQVVGSNSTLIHLNCMRAELTEMGDFVERENVEVSVPPAYWPGEYTMEPLYFTPTAEVTIEHLQIPQGEIAWSHGVRVRAADGSVGRTNKFLVDSGDGRITHLVLGERHLWGKKQVLIPISMIDHITEPVVYLKPTKRDLRTLAMIHMPDHKKEVK